MEKHFRFLLGMAIIVASFFAPTIEKMLLPIEPSVAQVLSIKEPDKSILEIVGPASKIVGDKQDREKMALLNFEFSERLKGYDCKPEEMILVWNHVAKFLAEGKWKNKYLEFFPTYSSDMIRSVTTDANTIVTEKEKEIISEKFKGLSWVLGNKDE